MDKESFNNEFHSLKKKKVMHDTLSYTPIIVLRNQSKSIFSPVYWTLKIDK